ncbi:MAG: hypothetical protein GY810_11330 [Aureispira sp.]|nr:hypothetical protein [Aureispira sp.]
MKTKNQYLGKNQFIVAPHIIKFDGLDNNFDLKIKRKNYPQKNIYTLRNLLTVQECQNLIHTAQKLGFQQAGLATSQDHYRIKEKTRNNKRVIFEDKALANTLWNRIAHLVDPKFQNHKAYGLNWRFRIYEYRKGNIFAPHVDERMQLPGKNLTTLFTFMIYLNENLEGGETTFFDRRKSGSKKLVINRSIKPKTGMALAFDHLLFHEGSIIKKGIKYSLRSDIVYQK